MDVKVDNVSMHRKSRLCSGSNDLQSIISKYIKYRSARDFMSGTS